MPVALLTSVQFAPATTAPLGSFTVPVMLPVSMPAWAQMRPERVKTTARQSAKTAFAPLHPPLPIRFLNFMFKGLLYNIRVRPWPGQLPPAIREGITCDIRTAETDKFPAFLICLTEKLFLHNPAQTLMR